LQTNWRDRFASAGDDSAGTMPSHTENFVAALNNE